MLRRIKLRWLFAVAWPIAFGAVYVARFLLGLHRGEQLETDWKFAAIAAASFAGLIVLIVKDLRDRPTPEQLAALGAIFQAGPGTLGAILVKRNGVPEVIATVRSREEYLELAASERLPPDHTLYLPEDA
jgi:hypothetical protein